jgi:hypothetical protein
MRLNISDSMLLGVALSAIALGTKWVWNVDDAVKLNTANQLKHHIENKVHDELYTDRHINIKDRIKKIERSVFNKSHN